jgi:hypothetical protein
MLYPSMASLLHRVLETNKALRSSKAARGPYSLSVFEEQVWERHHGNCQESQQRSSPMITEFVEHLVTK